MLTPRKIVASLAFLLPLVSASAGPLVYIVSAPPVGTGVFGTVDLATGAFSQIGPGVDGSSGLAPGPNGSLYTLEFNGNLNRIDPATGVTTTIGATGLADCSAPPASPCGPHSANTLGSFNGQLYATDFANNLYHVNTATGAATLIGATGIPVLPFTPLTPNPDNTFDAFDETLFGANGKLYATFDAITVSSATFTTASVVIAPDLYQIDPATGVATVVGPTGLNIGAVAAVNGGYFGFNDDGNGYVESLNLATGASTIAASFDPSVGIIGGAAALTPEPASLALTAIGIAGFAVYIRRKRAKL